METPFPSITSSTKLSGLLMIFFTSSLAFLVELFAVIHGWTRCRSLSKVFVRPARRYGAGGDGLNRPDLMRMARLHLSDISVVDRPVKVGPGGQLRDMGPVQLFPRSI